MKTCGKCGETKDDGLFRKDRMQCKACIAASHRKWNAANPEKAREIAHKSRTKHIEKAHKRDHEYYVKNKDVVLEKGKKRGKEWYAKNTEKSRIKTKKWATKNREKSLELSVKNTLSKRVGIPIKQIPTEIIQEKLKQVDMHRALKTLDAEKLASIDDQAARDIALAVTEGKTPDKIAVKKLKTSVLTASRTIVKKLLDNPVTP